MQTNSAKMYVIRISLKAFPPRYLIINPHRNTPDIKFQRRSFCTCCPISVFFVLFCYLGYEGGSISKVLSLIQKSTVVSLDRY